MTHRKRFGIPSPGLVSGCLLGCAALMACGGEKTPTRILDARGAGASGGGPSMSSNAALKTVIVDGTSRDALSAEDAANRPKNTVSYDGTTTCVAPTRIPRRIWRLTALQARETVRAAFADYAGAAGLASPPVSDSADGAYVNQPRTLMLDLPNRFPKAKTWAEATAKTLASQVASKEGCAGVNAACVESFAKKRLPILWRRPVTAEEITRLKALFTALASDPTVALEATLTATLLTPHFWYRSELGTKQASGAYKLTPLETASLISYSLMNSPPDEALLAAATRMTTFDAEEFGRHVDRLLLQKQKVSGTVANFYGDLFDHEELEKKAPLPVKASVDANANALRSEADAFVRRLVENDASFGTLMSSPEMPISSQTAPFYGRNDITGETRFVPSPAGRHAGLLTLPANLLVMSGSTEDLSFVHRGSFVLGRALCIELGAPPPNAVELAGRRPDTTGLSSRDIKLIHSSNPSCAGCHKHLDPVGLAFENFALNGSFRTTDARGAVVVKGDLLLDGSTLSYSDFPSFLAHVSGSKQVALCGARKLYEHTFGIAQGASADAACLATSALEAVKELKALTPQAALRHALLRDDVQLRYSN